METIMHILVSPRSSDCEQNLSVQNILYKHKRQNFLLLTSQIKRGNRGGERSRYLVQGHSSDH